MPKTWKSKKYFLYYLLTIINELKIRSSKLVRIVSETDQDIKKCFRVYILAVIDNRISHMGQFGKKSFFAGGGVIFFGNEKWLKQKVHYLGHTKTWFRNEILLDHYYPRGLFRLINLFQFLHISGSSIISLIITLL